jgi:uncharacterized protein (TIGR02145 family)
LKSGFATVFFLNQTDTKGQSLTRGGGPKTSGLKLTSSNMNASKEITNKKVLIYAADYTGLYKNPADMQKVVDILTNSGLALEVTLLKDTDCTSQVMSTFKDYGLVILDTHAVPDAMLIGTRVELDSNPSTDAQLQRLVLADAGLPTYNGLVGGDLEIGRGLTVSTSPLWWKTHPYKWEMVVLVTSKFVNKLGPMPNTVVFGNMCYSGQNITTWFGNATMKNAFMNLSPISYYGYSNINGGSERVSDDFAKEMEDSLVTALAVNKDSTGIAHLGPGGIEFEDKIWRARYNSPQPLLFKHFGADNYSYYTCASGNFTDTRDGHVYKTVCIGEQTWMAENLAYNAPGSLCYNDDPAMCITYGRLYDSATVFHGDAPSNANPSGVQGICPKGWHLPSDYEYNDLAYFLGDLNARSNNDTGSGSQKDTLAGGKMKAVSPLWMYKGGSPNVGATNSSGFSALPGGQSAIDGNGVRIYLFLGGFASFWMSTPFLSALLSLETSRYQQRGITGENGLSCRCVKDM